MQALRRKKLYEKQLEKMDITLTMVKCQKEAMENVMSDYKVFRFMKAAEDNISNKAGWSM